MSQSHPCPRLITDITMWYIGENRDSLLVVWISLMGYKFVSKSFYVWFSIRCKWDRWLLMSIPICSVIGWFSYWFGCRDLTRIAQPGSIKLEEVQFPIVMELTKKLAKSMQFLVVIRTNKIISRMRVW